jgi:hypothetical protein
MYGLCALKITDENNVHPQTEKNFCRIFGLAGETEGQAESYEGHIVEQKQQWHERKWQEASMTYFFNTLRSNDFRQKHRDAMDISDM